MAGVIAGVPRLPSSSSKARINRFNNGVGFKDATQVVVTGILTPPLYIGTASEHLPAAPTTGQVVVLSNAEEAGPALCMYYNGSWWFANSSELS